uniref:Uncharacterized protein n=1 Tax=Macrostomum lignano TaxID=282301 RepID=A0A1I8FSB0_9PLAT
MLAFLDEMLMNKKSSAGSKLKQLLKVKLKSVKLKVMQLELLINKNTAVPTITLVPGNQEPLCGSSYSFSSNCSCYSCKPTAKASTTPTGEAHEAEAALAAALAALVAASHSKPNGPKKWSFSTHTSDFFSRWKLIFCKEGACPAPPPPPPPRAAAAAAAAAAATAAAATAAVATASPAEATAERPAAATLRL